MAEPEVAYQPVEQSDAPAFVDIDGVGMEDTSKGGMPIFEELPVARVLEVSRFDVTDVQLVYTIEMRYRQVCRKQHLIYAFCSIQLTSFVTTILLASKRGGRRYCCGEAVCLLSCQTLIQGFQ